MTTVEASQAHSTESIINQSDSKNLVPNKLGNSRKQIHKSHIKNSKSDNDFTWIGKTETELFSKNSAIQLFKTHLGYKTTVQLQC